MNRLVVPACRRAGWGVASVALFVAAILRGTAAESGEAAPISLPPFLVEEASKGPPWRYGEAMGYEILSRCDDGMTRRIVEAHRQLHRLLGEILPPELQVKMTVPRILLLYDEALQPAASQEVIARLLRSSAPMPEPDAAPFFGSRTLRIASPVRRAQFLPNLRLWDRDSLAIFMIARRDDFDADRLALTPDYVAFLVRSRLPALPPWFLQGFLTLYQGISFGGGELSLEAQDWISPAYTEALKKDPQLAPPLLPLRSLLLAQVPVRTAEDVVDPLEVWRSEALLFVRWGLDPSHGRRQALWDFARRSAAECASETLFTACFGLSFAEAETELAAYLPSAVRKTIRFKPPRSPRSPPLALRNATEVEIARIKGDWERLEVPYVRELLPDVAPKYVEQALRTLRRAYDHGERDGRLRAVLGLCELEAGNPSAAREHLEAAAALGPMRPRANYELARLRLAEAQRAPAGAGGRLNVTQTAEVLTPLFAARQAEPPLPEVYELMAETWAWSAAKPTRAHLAVLDEGARFFPRRTELLLRAAELNAAHGYATEADEFLALAERVVDSDAGRARIEALRKR